MARLSEKRLAEYVRCCAHAARAGVLTVPIDELRELLDHYRPGHEAELKAAHDAGMSVPRWDTDVGHGAG